MATITLAPLNQFKQGHKKNNDPDGNWSLSEDQKKHILLNYQYETIGTMQNTLSLGFFAIQNFLKANGLTATTFSKHKPAKNNSSLMVVDGELVEMFDMVDYFKELKTI